MSVTRERRVGVKWIGRAQSEAAAMQVLGYPLLGIVDGDHERWMDIPVSRVSLVETAIEMAGGRVLRRR